MKRLNCTYNSIVSLLSAFLFLLGACTIFTIKYTLSDTVLPLYFDTVKAINRKFFIINFYVPLGIYCASLGGCWVWKKTLPKLLCTLVSLAAAIITGYVLEDVLTIHLCIYSIFIIIIGNSFDLPLNCWLSGISIPVFIAFLFHPPFLGLSLTGSGFKNPDVPHTAVMFLYLFCFAGFVNLARYLRDKYIQDEATISHLNAVGTNMLLFNHRLQEYVKNSGEEAAKQERLKFTSELHDNCGYVFTNIIAITDAAISCGDMETWRMQDTFQLIQSQAREGLKRTRETLHMIRELQDPVSGSIDGIYEMRRIFQDVTGIKVDIESGNMKFNYGPTVNRTLNRIVQEAFTNSVRHGQSTRILIHLWEYQGTLSMTVRDNGIGAKNIVKGIGLAGMEERLAAIGGALAVSSPEDGGFQIKVDIPLPENRQSEKNKVPTIQYQEDTG
jgi:signal transduction histidine kinase